MAAGVFKKLQAKLKDKMFKQGVLQEPENSESFKKWLRDNPPKLAIMPRIENPKIQ
jgi:hypothetical protein